MQTDVPYLLATGNLPKILDKIQNAGAPETFNLDFLKDLGFTSSQDRPTPKLLKDLGLLDSNGHPTASYKEFMDHTKAKSVLAARLRLAYDDLFTADKKAYEKSSEQLKGWFKTKTGAGDSVADKIARTFKTLATYADFKTEPPALDAPSKDHQEAEATTESDKSQIASQALSGKSGSVGLVYRFEIHLPDTQNVDTFRAIFRALREELL
jgi:hypothetical protein